MHTQPTESADDHLRRLGRTSHLQRSGDPVTERDDHPRMTVVSRISLQSTLERSAKLITERSNHPRRTIAIAMSTALMQSEDGVIRWMMITLLRVLPLIHTLLIHSIHLHPLWHTPIPLHIPPTLIHPIRMHCLVQEGMGMNMRSTAKEGKPGLCLCLASPAVRAHRAQRHHQHSHQPPHCLRLCWH